MAEPTTSTTVNTGNTNSSSNSNSNGNSNPPINPDIVTVVDMEDDDSEGCCGDPGASLLRLGSGDVMVVSVERGELSAAKYQVLAEETAAKFKVAFPSNKILVIPSTTKYKVVKQPEVS